MAGLNEMILFRVPTAQFHRHDSINMNKINFKPKTIKLVLAASPLSTQY